jgi:CelD/BcsL family acetyltransferase involved in cellulose biosynthesis
MLRALLDTSRLSEEIEVWLARFDGVPVAFLLNFLSGERTCYYQGAYDKAYGTYSPGAILHYHAIERTWRENRHEYDFMMGNEPWKSGWANEVRTLSELVLYRKSPRGLLAYVSLAAPRAYARKILKGISTAFPTKPGRPSDRCRR